MNLLRKLKNKEQQQISQENPASSSLNFRLKNIKFKGRVVPIVLQHMNGPCPLLAVVNILTLRGHPLVHALPDYISAQELFGHVSRFILQVPNSESTEENRRNFEVSKTDAMQVLPKTFAGLDINVKFKGITSCEFTKEMTLFDFCKIRIVHGWLPDPQDNVMSHFLHDLSYDQLLDKLICLDDKSSENTAATQRPQSMSPNTFTKWQSDQDKLSTLTDEAMLAERYLNETASQMTCFGLSALHAGLYEEELCILFRNNHYSTLYKHGGQLYDLVTDLGIGSGDIVWERLVQIDGNTVFVKSDFTLYVPSRPVFHSFSVVNPNVDPIFAMKNTEVDPNSGAAPTTLERKHRFRRYKNRG